MGVPEGLGDALADRYVIERELGRGVGLEREWLDWNATMLPEVKGSFTHGFSGDDLADHYGAEEPGPEPDVPMSPDTGQ